MPINTHVRHRHGPSFTGHDTPQIARFMGPTWGPPGSCRPQMGPMLAPWTLLSGTAHLTGRTQFPLITAMVALHKCPSGYSQGRLTATLSAHSGLLSVFGTQPLRKSRLIGVRYKKTSSLGSKHPPLPQTLLRTSELCSLAFVMPLTLGSTPCLTPQQSCAEPSILHACHDDGFHWAALLDYRLFVCKWHHIGKSPKQTASNVPNLLSLAAQKNVITTKDAASWRHSVSLGWRALKTPTSETPDFLSHVTPLTLQYLCPRPPGFDWEGLAGSWGTAGGHSGPPLIKFE